MPTENTKVLVVLDRLQVERHMGRAPKGRQSAPYLAGLAYKYINENLGRALDAEQEKRVEYRGERQDGLISAGPPFISLTVARRHFRELEDERSMSWQLQSRTITQLPDGGQYVGPWRDLEEGE